MGMPDLVRPWTRDEVLALPDDGNRYELIDGILLVTPAPRPVHQLALARLYDRLRPYVALHGLGELLWSPADLELERGYVSQPDLYVIDLDGRRPPADWSDVGVPCFVIEVLSPSTGRFDRAIKRPAYQRAGVGEYWIVDPAARLIERWQPADQRPEVCLSRAVWCPRSDLPPFELDLEEYFAAVWGDSGLPA